MVLCKVSANKIGAHCLSTILPICLLVVSIIQSGCATTRNQQSASSIESNMPKQVKSLLEMRRDRTVVQEWDLSCGAAALATLLNFQHGDPVSEREIATGLIQREEYIAQPKLVQIRQGFSLLDLKRYVEQRGYQGIGYGGLNVEDLIDRAPIMVPVDFHGYNHFVVFRGAWGNRVALSDPAWGNRTMHKDRFEKAWIEYRKIGKVGFVVKRRDEQMWPNRLQLRPQDFAFTK